ncbi:hypothetical protein AGMMS49992_22450 [Clostridia bacterium]|nr:hypothetical protein AGMMS49992_22450 [Clostridia bacterium]
MEGAATLTMTGGSITGNTATSGNGGGIDGVNLTSARAIDIAPTGTAAITNNAATSGNGGGIYVSRANLTKLFVGAGATFSGNSSSKQEARDPNDDTTYNSHISASIASWSLSTAGYDQGYNNYDIAYSQPPPNPPNPPKPPRPPRPPVGGGSGGYLSGGAGGYVTWSSSTSLVGPNGGSAGSSGSAGTGVVGGRYPTSGQHLCRLNCVKAPCGTFCLANCVTLS